LKHRLDLFAADFDGKQVAEITGQEIDGWLRGLSRSGNGMLVSPTTRNNFRRVLIVAFNFALENGYCATNPAKACAEAKEIESKVGILSPAELAGLLESCDESLLPFVAIGAFAGLRRAELERLDWSEIDFESGLIEVTAKKAKSARRRFVKIRENLAAWLRPYAKHQGPLAPDNYRELLDVAKRTTGFGVPGSETEEEKAQGIQLKPWPNNALRHSFASYHLAHFKDAAALALELGHTNSNLVFQHYREVVKPKDGERYWDIKPDCAANVVAMTA
jgi:integrase